MGASSSSTNSSNGDDNNFVCSLEAVEASRAKTIEEEELALSTERKKFIERKGSVAYLNNKKQRSDDYGAIERAVSESEEAESLSDEIPDNAALTIPLYMYILAGCAALNSCNLGFDIGINTDAGILIQNDLNLSDVQLELFMGSINLFSLVGAVISSPIVKRYGLRGAFVITNVGFIVGIILMITSYHFVTLMIGRVFVGLGVGFGMTITPVYIAEISSEQYRGYFVSWSEVGINIGILIGFISGFIFYGLPPDIGWRYMFASGMIMPFFIIFLAIFVMSESPRWLVTNKNYKGAFHVLSKLYPHDDATIKHILNGIIHDIHTSEERNHTSKVTWYNLLCNPSPTVKRMLLVGFGTAISQQLSGIDAIQYYLVFIFESAGVTNHIKQTMFLTGIGLLKLSCLFIAAPLMDYLGRRPLIIISLSGMVFALALISTEYIFMAEGDEGNHNVVLVIIGLGIYMSFFSFGMGPLGWIIPSEIFSTTIRSKAVSATTFINRLTGFAVASSILTISNTIGFGGYFLLLTVICICILAFFIIYLPETKGKELEEMIQYFANVTNDTETINISLSTTAIAEQQEENHNEKR